MPDAAPAADGEVRLDYDDHLAILTLDRPDRLNAMSDHMERQLWDAFAELETRDDVYCVLWRAEGRAFSAGRDVSELGNRGPGESDYHYIEFGHRHTHRHLVPPRVPIVCAIQGWCIGGMWERALLCDVRIAADDAKFRLPELAHGVIPDSGGTARLFQICGPGLVSDLVLTTRALDAEEALRHGIVSRVVPRAELDETALGAARTIAAMPPLAVRAWRQNLLDLATPPVQKAIHDELLGQMLVYTSEDFQEFRAARAEDRPPNYRVT
jgi:enoyl-CoA hydratase/carnithine racemase